MRIRERLIALSSASLSPQRSAPPAREPLPGAAVTGEEEPPAAAASELPREVVERMLHAIHLSQARLLQTTEVIAMIASAVAHADAILRRRPLGLPTTQGHASPPGILELAASAIEAANMRGSDGTYLLIGDHAAAAPFSLSGAFLGTTTLTALIIVPGPPPGLAVAAAALTAHAPAIPGSHPVDILPLLHRISRASPSANNLELHEALTRAASQLAHLQSKIALALSVLSDAAGIAEERAPAPSAAAQGLSAVLLAQTFGAIEAARSLAERTLAVFPQLV